MAAVIHARVRPSTIEDHRAPSRPRTVGLVVALLGLILTTIAFFANLVAAGVEAGRESTLAWSFGLNTLGLGVAKLGIAVVLWGILMKLWVRVDAVKRTLARIITGFEQQSTLGDISTPYGRATVTLAAPPELAVHRMAKRMWNPMLVMGAVALAIGFIVSLAWASGGGTATAAWTQGLQFLGEGMLLSGIAFLLGTILWAIRTGGGEVQEELGAAVKTLRMPASAQLFVFLMMLGLMVSIAQFIGYLIVAGGGVDTAAWSAFLGPFRELGLALILSGITLALVAIGNALGFQFSRVIELIKSGR